MNKFLIPLIFLTFYFTNIIKNLKKYKVGSNAKGLDLRYLNTPKEYETMLVEFVFDENTNMDILENKIQNQLDNIMETKNINEFLINFNEQKKYEILDKSYFKDIFFLNNKINLNYNFTEFTNRSKLNAQLCLNKDKKKLYGYGFHGIHDGLKLLKLIKYAGILNVEDVGIKLPKFKYFPNLSEFFMYRSLYDIATLKKSLIIHRENNRTFKPNIIEFNCDLEKYNHIKISKNVKIIGIILYSLMDKLNYPRLNASLAFGIDGIESQRNQTSILIITVKYYEDFEIFMKNLNDNIHNKSYQVSGTYFASTFNTLNNINYFKRINREKIDINLSCIPLTISKLKVIDIDCKLKIWNPYHQCPIYSLNYIQNNILNGYVSIKLKDTTFGKNITNNKILNII